MERKSVGINTFLDIKGYEFKPGSTYLVGVTFSKDLPREIVETQMRALKDVFDLHNINVILYPKGIGIDNIEVLEAHE